jgi:hypothetical protein
MRCLHCNGEGEYEHPAWRELDNLWLKGLIFDEEAVTDFWLDRGYSPANPPQRYALCPACGGTGDMDVSENPALEARALAAWRAANPEGLIGRLIALHRRNRALALVLAQYAQRYAPTAYQGLVLDVASWHVRERGACPSCAGSGRWEDDIPCGRCEGRGVA